MNNMFVSVVEDVTGLAGGETSGTGTDSGEPAGTSGNGKDGRGRSAEGEQEARVIDLLGQGEAGLNFNGDNTVELARLNFIDGIGFPVFKRNPLISLSFRTNGKTYLSETEGRKALALSSSSSLKKRPRRARLSLLSL